MGEIQLRADTKSNAGICKSWNIVTIPRFAILDREGKVVDANAPFPSSKEIKGVLNRLL